MLLVDRTHVAVTEERPLIETVSVYEVEDVDHSQRLWEAYHAVHEAGGVRRNFVLPHPEDARRFVVTREIDDFDQARTYLASPARQGRMKEARVVDCVDYLPRA